MGQKKIFSIFIFILISLSVISLANATLIGEDVNKYNEFPWNTVGLVESDVGVCSGTIVGRGLVLTAAHCVCNDDGTLKGGDLWFYPNWHYVNISLPENRRKSRVVEITRGKYSYTDGKYDPKNDWALLQLDQPLGDKYGWLGIVYLETLDEYKDQLVVAHQIIGYPAENYWLTENGSGNVLRVDRARAVKYDKTDGSFMFDSYSSGGNSGGPLFTWVKEKDYPYISGVYVGRSTYKDGTIEGIVQPTSAFKKSIDRRKELSKDWDYKPIGTAYNTKYLALKNTGYKNFTVSVSYKFKYQDGQIGSGTGSWNLSPGSSFYLSDSDGWKIAATEVEFTAEDENGEKSYTSKIVVNEYRSYEKQTVQFVLGQTKSENFVRVGY